VAVADADAVSPEAVAEQTKTVVAVKGPNVAGLVWDVRLVPLAVQAIVAPAVADETTGDTDPVKVSVPGANVGVATTGMELITMETELLVIEPDVTVTVTVPGSTPMSTPFVTVASALLSV
jgi:hypothetical protein